MATVTIVPYKVKDRVRCPSTGKAGRVVFISPVNNRIYVEYDRSLPFITYPPDFDFAVASARLSAHNALRGGDLFAPL